MLRLVVVLLVLALGVSAVADDADLRAKVEQWLEDLQSDEFAVRETARGELRKHGTKARDLLEGARDHEDPEVRRTVRAILARVGSRPRPIPSARVADGSFDDVHRVTLDLKDVALEEALQQLGGRIGGRFKVPVSARSKISCPTGQE